MSNDPTPPVIPQPPVQPPPPFSTAPTPSAAPDESKARTWNMLCHLAALAGIVFPPFGIVLGPLLVWQIKKNEFPSVEIHGRAAVNFQLTVLIGLLASTAATFVGMFLCIGLLLVFVPTAIYFCGLIFAIIAGIKANDGVEYKYPYSLNLVG
jgi:uncharacterized protein